MYIWFIVHLYIRIVILWVICVPPLFERWRHTCDWGCGDVDIYVQILRITLLIISIWFMFYYFSNCANLIFSGVRITRSLVLCVMFCRSFFVLLSFLFWPLCCLSFDLRILITSPWYLQTLIKSRVKR